MSFSPIRSKLLSNQMTPSKIVVSCDINGWMETNQKSPLKKRNPKSYSRNVTRRLQTRTIDDGDTSSLVSLRARRLKLMRQNKKSSHSPVLQTIVLTERVPSETVQQQKVRQPKSYDQRGKTIQDFKIKLTEIQVSEFRQTELNNIKKSLSRRTNKNIPPLLSKPLMKTNRNSSKGTMNALKTLRQFEGKLNNNKGLIPRRKESNLLANPELKHLVFKSKAILSVNKFPIQ